MNKSQQQSVKGKMFSKFSLRNFKSNDFYDYNLNHDFEENPRRVRRTR